MRNFNYKLDRRLGLTTIQAKADQATGNLASDSGTASTPSEAPSIIREKKFHIPVSSIRTDRVVLSKIGVVIFSNGQTICTGTLNQNGGFDGGLHGSKTRIIVRFYGGIQGAESIADADLVCQFAEEVWVYKNRPISVNFGEKFKSSKVESHFDRITHLELEVEHVIDK